MNELQITDVKIYPISGSKKILANGNITFNGCLTAKVKIWNGSQGLWVGMEGQYAEVKNKETGVTEKKWFDAWWANKELKQQLTEAVLNKYSEITGNAPTSNNNSHSSYGHSNPTEDSNIPF
jgi:DNA-binding cell septation regulator SpoVG